MSHRYMLAGTSQNPYGPGSGGGGSDYGLGSGSAGGGVLGDQTLGADLPSFGVQEGNIKIDAPVIPAIAAVVLSVALGSSKMGMWGYFGGALFGYYAAKSMQILAKGQNWQQNV